MSKGGSALSRLKLIIADNDAEYVSGLEKFLIIYYPHRFDITSFISADKLYGYLKSREKNDILLIGRSMWKEDLCLKDGCIITLSDIDCEPLPQSRGVVKKYQNAEKIVSDIMSIYVSGCKEALPIKEGRKTCIVSVYSPLGGSGKSSIAAGLSILSVGRGMKAFYLNMEDMSCSESYFSGDSEQCFSNVIFNLKDRESNHSIVMEGVKCRDPRTGVFFFRPPENSLEMQELTQEDITALFEAFRSNAFYDVVFADMPSVLDKRCTALLSGSDVILSILLPGKNAELKNNKFLEYISIMKSKYGIDLSEKMITVRNRQENAYENMHNTIYDAAGPVFYIGEHNSRSGDKYDFELIKDVGFLSELSNILDAVIAAPYAQMSLAGGVRNA
jgi:cellulose biosynthesis protein BcsQ